MPNDVGLISARSPGGTSYHIVDRDYVRRIAKEHEPSIPLSTPLLNTGCRLKDKKTCIPHYGAGFFMDGLWFENTYLPRRNLEDRRDVLYALRGDPDVRNLLHPTTRIIYYYDRAGCAFLSLCSNHEMFSRKHWFSRRDEVLDAVCKSMQLNETETAQAKQAFRWHMIGPACYEVVPKEFVVGI